MHRSMLALALLLGSISAQGADDPLSDNLGTGVDLQIHLDFSQYTSTSTRRITTIKNSDKAELTSGSWTQFRIPYYSYSYMAPYQYRNSFGCFGGANSDAILEYIPSSAEQSEINKLDMNSGYNRYIFAVGYGTRYPSSNYEWGVMSKGQMFGSSQYYYYYGYQAGRGWNFGWSGTSVYYYYIYTNAIFGFAGRTDYYASSTEQAQASIRAPFPASRYLYGGWTASDIQVMVGWTEKVGSYHKFHVGLNGDFGDATGDATRNQQTFQGISSAYSSLSAFGNMRYHSSKKCILRATEYKKQRLCHYCPKESYPSYLKSPIAANRLRTGKFMGKYYSYYSYYGIYYYTVYSYGGGMMPGRMGEYLIYTAPTSSPMSMATIKRISGYLQKKYQPGKVPALWALAPESWLDGYSDGLSRSGCGAMNSTTSKYDDPISGGSCYAYCGSGLKIVRGYYLTYDSAFGFYTYARGGGWSNGVPQCGSQCSSLGMPENSKSCRRLHTQLEFDSSESESMDGPAWYPYLVPFKPDQVALETAFKWWSINSNGRLEHNEPSDDDDDSVPCPSGGSGSTAVAWNKLVAHGSKHTYRHATDRELTVEAKFIIPDGSKAAIYLRRDTGEYNGYSVELVGGEKRAHTFTERAYGYVDGAYGYTDVSRGNFKADCSIPTDSSSEPQHIKVVQSKTGIKVYCGGTEVFKFTSTYYDTYGMQGIGASGDGVEIDDFEVSTSCQSDTYCDQMYTGEKCEFQCETGYVIAANTSATRTCDAQGDFESNALECRPAPPTLPPLTSPFEVEERSKPGTFVGVPIQGTTASEDQAILWYIKPDGNNDGSTKDANGDFLPVFRIGVCDGQIKVANALIDYVNQQSFTITVIGKTDGDDRAAAEVQVTINVIDVNDPPVMDQADPIQVGVDENSAVGTNVLPGPFTATDPDATTDFKWAILAGNDDGFFTIGETTGYLSVAKEGLNYEDKKEHLLFVTVADPDGADDGRQVNVTLRDVNDPPEVLELSYTVEELNATTGSVITVLESEDEDGDDITYRIVSVSRLSPSVDGNYLTDSSTTRTALAADYEIVELRDTADPNDGNRKQMQFTVDLTYDVAPQEGDPMYPFEYDGELVRAVYEIELEAHDGTARRQGKQTLIIMSDLSARDLAQTPALTGIQVCDGECDDTVRDEVDVIEGMLTRGTSGSHVQGVKIQALNLVAGAPLEVTYAQVGEPMLSYTATCEIKKSGSLDSEGNDEDYLVCTVPPGAGKNFRWKVVMRGDQVAASAILSTSYAEPKVTSIAGPNHLTETRPMSTAGGETIVLTGTNLGFEDIDLNLVQVRYGFEADVPEPFNEADFDDLPFVGTVQASGVEYDELQVRTGEGYGYKLSLFVRVAGQVSQVPAADQIEYGAPDIQSVGVPAGASHSLDMLDSAGGQTIVITGSNFGPLVDINGRALLPKVTYGTRPSTIPGIGSTADHEYVSDGVVCTKDVATAHTTLTCTTGAGVGRDHYVKAVMPGDATESITLESSPSSQKLSYLSPVITRVFGPGAKDASTSGGDLVEIDGAHFGPVAMNAIEVVQFGLESDFPAGSELYEMDQDEATGACEVVRDPARHGVSRVNCRLIPGRGAGYSWALRVGGQMTEAIFEANSSYSAPTIAGFDDVADTDMIDAVRQGRTQGGDEIEIYGDNFGPVMDAKVAISYRLVMARFDESGNALDPEIRTFAVDGSSCSMVVDHKRIRCELAVGGGADLKWTMVVDGLTSRDPVTAYALPVIDSIERFNGDGLFAATVAGDAMSVDPMPAMPQDRQLSPEGGDYVELVGRNFGPSGDEQLLQEVRFGNGAHQYVLRESEYRIMTDHTRIRVRVPPGVGADLSFVVVVADQESAESRATVSYAAPEIISISPAFGHAEQDEYSPQMVTVTGKHFGFADGRSTLTVDFGHTADGTLTTGIATVDAMSGTGPYVPAPAGSTYSSGYDRSATQKIKFALPSGLGRDRAIVLVNSPAGFSQLALRSAVDMSAYTTMVTEGPINASVVVNNPTVLTYQNPSIDFLSLDPIDDSGPYANDKLTLFPGVEGVKLLRVHGRNFGASQGDLNDQVRRSVLIAPTATPADFSAVADRVQVVSWTDTVVEVMTPVDAGFAKVALVSLSYDGAVEKSQVSQAAQYYDVSPQLAGLQGANAFNTAGGEILELKVARIGQANRLEVDVGGQDCPLVLPSDTTQSVSDANFVSQILDAQVSADGQYSTRIEADDGYFQWTITCVMPSGPVGDFVNDGSNVPVLIKRYSPGNNEAIVSDPQHISYAPPTITEVRVWHDTSLAQLGQPDEVFTPTDGVVYTPTRGAIMQIVGDNFGVCPQVRLGFGNTFELGEQWQDETSACQHRTQDAARRSRSHTMLELRVPQGEGDGTDPALGGMPFAFRVTVGGQDSQPMVHSHTPPAIQSVTLNGLPRGPTRGGVRVLVRGTNFGEPSPLQVDTGVVAQLAVHIGRDSPLSQERAAEQEITDTSAPGMLNCSNPVRIPAPANRPAYDEIECTLAEGTGARLDAVIDVAGVQSEPLVDAFAYMKPSITGATVFAATASQEVVQAEDGSTQVTVRRGPAAGFYEVELDGENFGARDNDTSCAFVAWPNRDAEEGAAPLGTRLRNLVCDQSETVYGEGEVWHGHVLSWTHDRVRLLMPPGVGMRDITLRVRGQQPEGAMQGPKLRGVQAGIEGVAFQYNDPEIDSIEALPNSVYDVPTAGGAQLVLKGRNFGRGPITSPVVLQSASQTFQAGSVPLPLHTPEGDGELDMGTSSLPQGVLPTAGMAVQFYRACLSVARGLDGTSQLGPDSAVAQSELAVTGLEGCSARASWTRGVPTIVRHQDNEIVFVTPEGLGTNREVMVSHFEQNPSAPVTDGDVLEIRSNVLLVNYSRPFITSVTPQTVEIRELEGRHPITIKGRNFGPTGSTEGWSEAERLSRIHIGARECFMPGALPEGAQRSVAEVLDEFTGDTTQRAVLECHLDADTVGSKNITVQVAGQRRFADITRPPLVQVVCDRDYFGLEGEMCLPCPEGGVCDGYDQFNNTHTMPRPMENFYNLNSSDTANLNMLEVCPPGRQVVAPRHPLDEDEPMIHEGGPRDVCIVACEPQWACVGDNFCARGYASKAPMYRCASCDTGFYRRAGECVKCPDNPWILIVAFVLMAMTAGCVGLWLNRSKINIALIAIGVDYFQVLAIFANARVSWPPMLKDLFHILSAFNLNLEITAPECTVPELAFQTKWYFIVLLPLAVIAMGMVAFAAFWLYALFTNMQKDPKGYRYAPLVAGLIVLLYFLYLHETKTILDVFNCVPTTPPDGQKYLQAVFEPCGQKGGVQLQLMPFAVIALIVYTFGFPAWVAFMLVVNKETIMLDQLRRAQGHGYTFVSSDPEAIKQAAAFRVKFQRLYYYFKPEYYWWVMTIIARKALIAFCSLMFNTNASFQMAATLLVIFLCYTLQVKYNPYMPPAEYQDTLIDWAGKSVDEGLRKAQADRSSSDAIDKAAAQNSANRRDELLDTTGMASTGSMARAQQGGLAGCLQSTGSAAFSMCARSPELYYSLWDTIRSQDKRQEKANQRSQNSLSSTRINAAAVDPKDVMGVMGSNVMNWNTVETVLLFCAILVTLGGIMLESGRFDQEGYQDQRDAITIILMLIIMSSITYYFTVFGLELYMLVTAKDRARRLQQASIKKVKEGKTARKTEVDMSNAEYSANPLMDVSTAGKDSGADGDSALLQNMRGMMELESLDRHSWVRLRSQFKEFVLSYEDMSKEHKRLAKEAMRSGASGASPMLGASSPRIGAASSPKYGLGAAFANPMGMARGGKKKEFGRAASGRGLGSRRSSSKGKGLLLKSSASFSKSSLSMEDEA